MTYTLNILHAEAVMTHGRAVRRAALDAALTIFVWRAGHVLEDWCEPV